MERVGVQLSNFAFLQVSKIAQCGLCYVILTNKKAIGPREPELSRVRLHCVQRLGVSVLKRETGRCASQRRCLVVEKAESHMGLFPLSAGEGTREWAGVMKLERE